MRRAKVPEIQIPIENGIHTIRFIKNDGDQFRFYRIKLKDGDEISIRGFIAHGILKIHESLNAENQREMESMELLALLSLYEKAIQDKVLSPPILRLQSGDYDVFENKWISRRKT
jgi:hypothetical protein